MPNPSQIPSIPSIPNQSNRYEISQPACIIPIIDKTIGNPVPTYPAMHACVSCPAKYCVKAMWHATPRLGAAMQLRLCGKRSGKHACVEGRGIGEVTRMIW